MTNKQDKIDQLFDQLETLLQKQEVFTKEINQLRSEITELKGLSQNEIQSEQENDIYTKIEEFETIGEEKVEVIQDKQEPTFQSKKSDEPRVTFDPKPREKSDIEKFIGENLINKIGIVITVIGVSIGAKYAIDHDLISPLTRIILGYLVGIGLLGFAFNLKNKYENFSAVLLSGAMAIMYFITFTAYSFYDLFPQTVAFILMVIFTVFTVIAAINYNQQVIAIIGMAGAYAVPFLLSEGSGKVVILFSYMAIINTGILAIAFKKCWKLLYYIAFGLTWLIYFSWYVSGYSVEEYFVIGQIFLVVFFVLFYLTFLSYKLLGHEKFQIDDIVLLLANSFIYFGIGYSMLSGHEIGKDYLGVFTLCNALVHFIVSTIIYKRKLADDNIFYLVSGLVLVFITITIPVQLDGNWVTILWALESALLFWIGRTKRVPVYERLSYPLMLLAFVSIILDWSVLYYNFTPEDPNSEISPIFNTNFLSSLLFIGAFTFIHYLFHNKKYKSGIGEDKELYRFISFAIPSILLFVVFNAFRLEIVTYWNQKYAIYNYEVEDFINFKTIWVINYSLLFTSLLSFINLRRIKNEILAKANIGFNVLVILVFLLEGLIALSILRDSYLTHDSTQFYQPGIFNILIRYVSYILIGVTLYATKAYAKQGLFNLNTELYYEFLLHVTILWVASSELINWMTIADASQSDKLGLSILWGGYSLLLISIGIWKKKKHLRVGAIVLFGITLVKLFFYDITHLDTIAKTIVFVSLGILLLIISFLYNKYKYKIANELEN